MGVSRRACLVLALAMLLASSAGCGGNGGGGDTDAPEAGSAQAEPQASAVSVQLAEENRSGQTGTARLVPTADGDGFEATIEMTPPKKFRGPRQHAHIHNVTCAEYAGMTDFNAQLATVVNGFSDLRDNRSTSTVSIPLSDYTTGEFSINVHEQNQPYTAVACGDIPKQ